MMEYRKIIETTEELAQWYDAKYTEMNDGWFTPAEECNQHLDDLAVPFDSSKRLMDVGCGAGHFLAEAEKRVHAEGIDVSETGLCYAQQRVKYPENLGKVSIENLTIAQRIYDYIVSLGSLEHIVDLPKALDNIHGLLKPDGKFYFYCPNERWPHFDQPNERTMTDSEWCALFASHGLYVHTQRRWNDNTAFIGTVTEPNSIISLPPHGDKLNIGSGQRRFDTAHGWVNIDATYRPPDQVPDLVCNVGKERLPYEDGTIDCCVLHHLYEHLDADDGHRLVAECYRVLKVGGSLIVTVPDMRALAQRWMLNQIDDYIYFVNVYGAYQGMEEDRHKRGFHRELLKKDLQEGARWSIVKVHDWRKIPGADIAKDWWILGIEAIK